jgi:hypothetical protein
MKYCPTCDTRYEEDILRFCMKDGTPLLEDAGPSFTTLPSENLPEPPENDDPGEITVIRRNVPTPPPDPEDVIGHPVSGERIVIPTYTPQATSGQQPIVSANIPPVPMQPVYQPPPPRTNTLAIVAFTMFGTVFTITIGALLVWFLVLSRPANSNINANINGNANTNYNTNVNTNLGINTSTDFNTNLNSANLSNTNIKTPTPTPSQTPTPTPTPTPRPSPTPSPDEDEQAPVPSVNNAPATPRPSPIQTPRLMQSAPGASNSNRP